MTHSTHPLMFSGDSPQLLRVRRLALGFPSAAEKISHGIPAFFTTKVFAYYGGSPRNTQGIRHPDSVLIKADPAELPALAADPRFYSPAYLWPGGWIGLILAGGTHGGAEDSELRELLETSYRLTAPRRLVNQLPMAR